MKNKYRAGQYWLKKINEEVALRGGLDYRLLFILKTYVKPETKTKTPRFVYLTINISRRGRYHRVHDKSISCLRNSLTDFKEITEQNLDFVVKYGSIKDVVVQACKEVQQTSSRHIAWYQRRITKEQRLIDSIQEGVVAPEAAAITKI